MKLITKDYHYEELIKKSRFIGLLLPCDSETDAQAYIKHVNTDYADASHVVYAYRIKTSQGLVYRFYDAGEPSGTAGKPLLQQLEGKQLMNALLIVVRYFGGIKLGAGGLTRAYGNTARKVLEQAELMPFIEWLTLSMTLAYERLQQLEYTLKTLDGKILEQEFSGHIRLQVQLPKPSLAQFNTRFADAINSIQDNP
ncbi:YigZ family protein [Methylocucumis oryzae]|uniref:YigZ family protein n=1 Tax=Methylocucumis oryzae TaxID=1632867 RepID=A0A0F3IK69_9GAMM|nr:YigZ family protein [Methylocucumis oryzae]KJV06943.1 hypothetical protein VZ94_08000 [Methylocucumis oryzae]